MGGQHGHNHHAHGRAGSAFRWGIALNSGLTALQLAIGFGFGSLALIGDALHNLGDVVGLALGWGADRLSRRPARGRFTYGFGRSTQMVSLVNGALGLLREALALNLDAAPRHVDLDQVEQALASLPGVPEIEELHVWGLSTSRTALTAHVVIDSERLQGEGLSRDQLLERARHRLEAFGIRKSTLQLESAAQPDAAQPDAAH